MRRVVIIGPPCAGKSTLARRLADRLGLLHVELDALAHGPGWTSTSPEIFRRELEQLTAAGRWVCDGNYFDRASWIWPQADTVIWLDIPLRVILPRLVRRSLRRIITRQELWNGNREQWSALLGRDSLLAWAVTSSRLHHRDLPPRLEELSRTGCTVVRLSSKRKMHRWCEQPIATLAAES